MQDLNEQQLEALENVQVLIDGPFVESLKDIGLVWKRLVQSASLEKRRSGILENELRPNALRPVSSIQYLNKGILRQMKKNDEKLMKSLTDLLI